MSVISQKTTLSAYYFPNYHADPRNEQRYGKGWTEWELLKKARPRYEGHVQPLEPLWGYDDEAKPEAMQRRIDAAMAHGIGHFIFDWYHYNDGPFLQRALDEGFLGASNPENMKFSLMWANHDWFDIFPAKLDKEQNLLFPGHVTRKTFERIVDLICERYFSHPNYFNLDGKPYFSIYHIATLIESLGGERGLLDAIEYMRKRVESFGLPGVHLNAIGWDIGNLQGELRTEDPFDRAARLGFDSATSYVWVHHVDVQDPAKANYQVMADEYFATYEAARSGCSIPVYPNVTMGWDPSPRTDPSGDWQPGTYPFSQVLRNNTPRAVGEATARALDYCASFERESIVTINAWNEWTEGSYLEPDTRNGYAYLEAIRSATNRKVVATV